MIRLYYSSASDKFLIKALTLHCKGVNLISVSPTDQFPSVDMFTAEKQACCCPGPRCGAHTDGLTSLYH